jgi:CHAT domain-containing protein/tetratricopeptide (TPR) repeat protein
MQTPSIKAFLIFVLLLIGQYLSAQIITQDSLINREYDRLYQINERGDFATAIDQGEAFLSHLIYPDTNTLGYGNLMMVIGTARYNYGSEADSTYAYLQKALRIFTRAGHPRMADACERLGQFHFYYTQDYVQTVSFLNQSEAIHLEQHPIDSSKLCGVYMDMLLVNTALANYSAALAIYQKAVRVQKDDYDAGNLNNAMGDFYYQQSLYIKGLEYFSKAEKYFKRHYGDTTIVATFGSIYANKGNCYMHIGDYTKAIHFYNKALQIFENKLSPDHPYILNIKSYIGFCYADANQFEQAINILVPLSQAIAEEEAAMRLSLLNKMAYCFARQKRTAEFNVTMDQILPLLTIQPYPTPLEEAIAVRSVGVNFSIAERYQEARTYYYKALDILDTKVSEKVKMRDYLHMDLGYLFYSLQQIDSSVYYFEKALDALEKPIEKTSLEYYYIAYGLSLSKYQQFLAKGKPTHLDDAIDLMEASVAVILSLRNTYTEQADKQFLNSEGNEVFDKLIGMYLQKNTLLPNINHLKRCFWLSEQNKNTLLMDNITRNNLGEATVLTDSIRASSQLINKLSRSIKETEKTDPMSHLGYLRSQYIDAQSGHEQLLAQLKKQYPQYYDLFFESITVTSDVVQAQLLAPNQALLEYFVGDSSIFIFVLRTDTLIVKEVKRDFPLADWIDQLRVGLYGYYTADHAQHPEISQEKSLDLYLQYALQLYEKLFAPVARLLPEKVIVVPDGPLSYVPFDALLTTSPKDINNFKTYPYLLKEHQFSYTYSATLLKEMINPKRRQNPNKWLAAFAPFCISETQLPTEIRLNTRKGLKRLPFSCIEAASTAKLMDGDLFTGATATKAQFVNIAGNYRILHLASHGWADNRLGDYAYIAFAEIGDSMDNERLYTKDIYHLELNADLIVLSACETGIGKLQRGEGIISLSRAFAYAGTKSILTTLWEVKDKSNSELMPDFYSELQQGRTKDAALRLARLKYLDASTTRNCHPFFWAGFVPVGDMRPVKK